MFPRRVVAVVWGVVVSAAGDRKNESLGSGALGTSATEYIKLVYQPFVTRLRNR